MLQNQTKLLLTTINNDNSSDEEVNSAIKDFLNLFSNSTEIEKDTALKDLCFSLESNNGKYINVLANVIGYLFEKGERPDQVITQLIKYYESLLIAAVKITESFAKKMESLPPVGDEEDEPDIYELFEEHYQKYKEQNPEAARAWAKLEETWCCGIALFSVSKTARNEAKYLRSIAHQNSEFSGGAHWFDLMFSVFDEEPFIAIDLEKGTGVKGKMSGVVDNFQLHILLMDAFPTGWFTSGNLAPEIIQNAKGFGEQCLNLTVTGKWNMFDWTVYKAEITPSDYSNTKLSDHWIWHEGKPEDIPLFEGHRVILLSKCSYERSWGAQRMFSQLKAELRVEQKLSKYEVNELLQRMYKTLKPLVSTENLQQ